MKRAAARLAVLASRAARATGIEGAFLVAGTLFLAIGASYLSPAGPWLVIGGVGVAIGIALALPDAPPQKPPRP